MALNKYLNRVLELLNDNKRRCNKEKECIHTVLAKLKSREDSLEARLAGHQPEKVRKAIERERRVVSAQRDKGLRMLRDLERNDHGGRYQTPHYAA